MSLTTNINISIGATQTETLDLGPRSYKPSFSIQKTLADGNGDAQSDIVFSDQRTVSSSPDDVDLNALTGQLGGGTLTWADISSISIYNKSSSYLLYCYTAPSNGVSWLPNSTYQINIRPGGWFSLGAPDATGLAVGSADTVRIASATGASIDYYLMVTGRT